MSSTFEISNESSSEELSDRPESLITNLIINQVKNSSSELESSSSDENEIEDEIVEEKYEGFEWGSYGIEDKPWHDQYCPVIKFKHYQDLKLTDLEKSGYLTDRIIAACSSYLEKNPINRKYVLCKCVLKNKGLNDISIIYYHHFLQYVDLSWNNIEDLSPLSSLSFLMYLDVSHNKLETILDFKPPHNLTFVNSSHNLIRDVKDLSLFWSLKTLDLSHNQISTIGGLSNLKYLETLDLSYNKIERIENLNNLNISNLYLQNNQIISCDCELNTMPYLKHIRLSHNSLSILKLFEGVSFLQSIDMQDNIIGTLLEISYLKDLKLLTYVNFNRNPIKNCENYELVCVDTIKNLQFLDENPIRIDQKISAQNKFSPDNKQQSNRDYSNILALSHLSQFRNDFPLNVIPIDQPPRPLIIIIGPVAGGQDTVSKQFELKYQMRVKRLKCHTTCERKENDANSDYYLIKVEEFNQMLERGEFLMVFEVFNNSYGLSQEEYGKGAEMPGAVMLFNADLNAALTMRLRGFQPVIILAMQRSVSIHRHSIAEFYETCVLNTRYPEAAVKVYERRSVKSDFLTEDLNDSFQRKNDLNNITRYLLNSPSQQEEETDDISRCDFSWNSSFTNLKFYTTGARDSPSAQDEFSYHFEQSESFFPMELTEEFYSRILKTREMLLEFHRSNPGVIYEVIYTDEMDTAVDALKRIVKTIMKTQQKAKPVHEINQNLLEEKVLNERLKMLNAEIECWFTKNPCQK